MQGNTAPLTVRLDGLRVAITAGAGGIGRALADSYASCGAKVVLCDVDQEALATCPYPSMLADMETVEGCEGFIDAAVAQLGGLDVLVNNAGIAGPTARVEDVTPEALSRTLKIDLESMFHCARRAVPALRAAGGGSIVNLSSAAGRFGFPLRSPYAAAKWGVIGFTKSLAIELGPERIRVNAILPGIIEGPRMEGVIAHRAQQVGVSHQEMKARYLGNISMRRMTSPWDVAATVAFLLSDAGANISGQSLGVDGNVETL